MGAYEMKRALAALVALACGIIAGSAAFAADRAPTYQNAYGSTRDAQGVVCVNPDTAALESCAGAGSGGGAVTIADSADATQGAKGDAACATDTGTCSLVALIKRLNQNVAGAIPAGTAIIGKVGIDQTTPGTTNNVTLSTNVGTLPIVQATTSVAISTTAAGGPTQLIAASGSTKIYVTHYDLVFSGAGTFAWVTGTGTNCGTGTTYLTGASGHPMSFAANGGISAGSGLGPILITGAGGELCYITTGAVDISGSVAVAQF